jgi:acetoin utilization deacetylase AcuC-like enzyme
MKTGIVKDWRFLEHRMGDYHPESPLRLRAIYEMLEKEEEFASYPLIEPRPATDEEIEYVHTQDYLEQIKDTAGRERVYLDPDTSTSPRSYEIACLAAGGVLEAADWIMEGRIQNAFAFIRPPGHHAEAMTARGFCIFNNIAIAAEHLIRTHGLARLLVVDWDLHHGNGTQHAFESRRDVLYFSTHQFPHYPGTGFWNEVGSGAGVGFTVNVPLSPGKTDDDFLFIFHRLLFPIARKYRPEFILVSAGFDIFAGDPLGGMMATAAGVGALTAALMSLAAETAESRLLLTLEGGYVLGGLVGGVKRVLEVLGGLEQPKVHEPEIRTSVARELVPVFKVQRTFWPVSL